MPTKQPGAWRRPFWGTSCSCFRPQGMHFLASPVDTWASSRLPASCVADVDDGLSEGPRGFLRQIVTNAAFDQPVLVLAGEFVAIRRRHRMRRTVGVAFKGDRGHGDDRSRAQLRFQIIVSLIAGRQAD